MRTSENSSLSRVFPSPAMARLVIFFLVHPGERYHLRELQRLTGLSSASVQKELRRLGEIGALRREVEGARAYFAADESNPAWQAWMTLIRVGARPEDVLREALVDVPEIEAAFVFGSSARGDDLPDSDVDVFLVGSAEARRTAARRLAEAQLLVPRKLDVIGYDRAGLDARPRSGFLRRVLGESKQWVRGDREALGSAA